MFELTFKNIDDLLRTTDCQTELDYVEQTSWIIFLKYLDDLDTDRQTAAKLTGGYYMPILDEKHRWKAWAVPKKANGEIDHINALTGDDLIDFVNRVSTGAQS